MYFKMQREEERLLWSKATRKGFVLLPFTPKHLPSIPQTDPPLARGEQDTTIQWRRRQETGCTQLSYVQLLVEEKCGNPRVL